MADDLLSTAEVAQLLGINPSTVVRLVRICGLPAQRIGWGYQLHRSEVETWVEAQRVQPGDLAHLSSMAGRKPPTGEA